MKFEDPSWRDKSPAPLANDTVYSFLNLARKTANGGRVQDILEDFKGRFSDGQCSRSSSADDAEHDLRILMRAREDNAALFVEAFFDACVDVKEQGYTAPSVDSINMLLTWAHTNLQIDGDTLVKKWWIPRQDADPTISETLPESDEDDESRTPEAAVEDSSAHNPESLGAPVVPSIVPSAYNDVFAHTSSVMPLKLEEPNWRFKSPGAISDLVVSRIYDLALEIATQGPRKDILEGFKYRFSNGKSGTSSSGDYAAYDLKDIMDEAGANAPKFILIFADYCEELRKQGKEVPDTQFLNEIFDQHNAGYQILGNEVVSTADVIVRTKITYPGREESFKPAASPAKKGSPPLHAPAATTTRFPVKVFLCHSSTDKAKVLEIYNQLKEDGFDPWLDAKNLKPGQHWETEIKTAVKQTHVFVVCLSKIATTKAGFAQREIKFALDVAEQQPEGTIFIIPAFIEACTLPERLSAWHWVRLYEEGGYDKLIDALDHRAKDLK